MRKLTILATVSFLCCGYSSSFAQIQILGGGQPTLAPLLVSDQTELLDDASLPSAEVQQAIPNPFDYFSDETAVPGQKDPQIEGDFSESGLGMENSLSDADPSSLSVGRNQRQTVVDTIVDQAVLGQIENASLTPVYWGGTAQTPNPVAQWLLREQCVQGLWSGYQQQRAQECERMWNHLSGSACGNCGAAGPCPTTRAAFAPGNRYKELQASCGPSCDQCAQYAPSSILPASANRPQPQNNIEYQNVATRPLPMFR